MEEVSATQLSNVTAEDNNTQESIDRVLESPPLYTQEDNSVNNNHQYDIEAQIANRSGDDQEDAKRATFIVFDNENTARCSREEGRVSRKSSDVIIDMGCDAEEILEKGDTTSNNDCDFDEFPDEEDAFLLAAVADSGEPVSEEPENLEELALLADSESHSQKPFELSAQLKADEEKRRKELEIFRKFKPLDKIFPDVRCSDHNTVAFAVKPNYTPGDPLEPNPSNCIYKWEPKFVRMPFCNENIIMVKSRVLPPLSAATESDNDEGLSDLNSPMDATEEDTVFGPPRKLRVWPRITGSLSGPTQIPLLCAQDFVTVFKRYCTVTTEFKALDYCLEQIMTQQERVHFFKKVVPFMVSLILSTSEIVTCPIPILRKNLNHNISFSQKQVACLLANAFFSTFPRKFRSQMEIPSINFKELFIEEDDRILLVKAQKIRCLINYFTRIESDMPQGVITYTRKNLRHSNMPEWGKLDKGLTKLVPLLQGTIEDDGAGMLQVDFANSFLGGGVLGRGAVQEEILFVIYPELILSRLFTEKLNYNEAVIVTGCERFSKYHGYSLNFRYNGDYQDTTPYDSKGRRCSQILAIDALYISRPTFQYHPKHILRELNKAYVGFSSPITSPVAIATGKWGCGAFNGNPQLKTVIQLLAASHAGRDVVLFTFEDVPCHNDVLSIYESIRDMQIKDVWNLLCQYHSLCCSSGKVSRSLKDFCSQCSLSQSWIKTQEQAKQSTSSTKPMKEIPITHFYPSDKRQEGTSPDDANVTAIINGMDQINSPVKQILLSGKRQREDEPAIPGMTEEEIQQHLLTESEVDDKSVEPMKLEQVPCDNDIDIPAASPKSPKRQKRLVDFFPRKDT